MKLLKLVILLLFILPSMKAQSFYTLTGVSSYDPMIINMSKRTKKYNEDIKLLIESMSKELGVNTKEHPSRILAFVISEFSVRNELALKVNLELGEYMKRDSDGGAIFAITYTERRILTPDFSSEEEIEDELADAVEEMLETFKLQHIEDNNRQNKAKKSVSHESFASDMKYEIDYAVALAKAKKLSKPLLVYMTTSYCPWCRKLENRILSQTNIDSKIKEKYIPIMLNFSKKNFPKSLREIALTPTLYVVDSQTEKIIHQFVGYSHRGEFLELLKSEK